MFAQKTKADIAQLEDEVENSRPLVADIRQAEDRWRTFQPAVDLHYFPLVQLNEITKAMPGSGVLIREYETRGRSIFVRGQAKDVQIAFQLMEDLKKNPAFSGYQWNMPQPKVEQNNTATFQIQGEPLD